MIRILRVSASGELVSADAFETLFQQHIGVCSVVDALSSRSFFSEIYELAGPGENFLRNPRLDSFLREKVGVYDFFSPGFGAFQVAPFFLKIRNLLALKTRLLFIAHAPGVHILEWALFAPLLKPGDLIIAPSYSAAEEISLISPRLSAFVKTIPHPVHSLPLSQKTVSFTGKRFVSLSRLHVSKLIHRQIEALVLLRERGGIDLRMDIAGPQQDSLGHDLAYIYSLKALIIRLGLEQEVQLTGTLNGDQAKADFFAHAHALLNLSVSLEESFGKSIVEALGSGLPVICTKWNGFTETAGRAGLFVPITFTARGNPDVKISDLAEAMEKSLLLRPTMEICRDQAQRSLPHKIVISYKQVLEDALLQRNCLFSKSRKLPLTFDPQGLLGTTALLKVFSYDEIFAYYLDCFYREIENSTGTQDVNNELCKGTLIREILAASMTRSLSLFLAHTDDQSVTPGSGSLLEKKKKNKGEKRLPLTNDFFTRLGRCTMTQADHRSQEICLLYCATNQQLQPLKSGLEKLLEDGFISSNLNYLMAELKCLENRFIQAYDLALQDLQAYSLTEFDSLRLRHLARIARKAGFPEKALPHLSAWLESFPDSPDSGVVWLDLCANAFYGGSKYLDLARKGFKEANALLGDISVLRKLSQKLFIEH